MTLIPTYYTKVGMFILPCLVLSIRVYLFNIALFYYVSLAKTRGDYTLIFVGSEAVVKCAGDFIFQNSEQWGLCLLCFWEVGIIEFSLF